jgi:trans-aconitate methyltransferase
MSLFADERASHQHSLDTLNAFYEHDDFMESIDTVVDLGCGQGFDLEWWATRTTRDENPQPLNIKCTGVDVLDQLSVAHRYPNITYQKTTFEGDVAPPSNTKFDVLWCHDAFQYAINPIQTLSNWWNIASDGGMMVIIVPQTTNIHRHQLAFTQESGCYYHHTLASLIHMLAVSGWDCKNGFFLKKPQDPWIHAVVYKSQHAPMDPRTTDWHTLSAMDLLPDSAKKSVYAHGELDQRDLVVPWLDYSLSWLGQQ